MFTQILCACIISELGILLLINAINDLRKYKERRAMHKITKEFMRKIAELEDKKDTSCDCSKCSINDVCPNSKQ